MSNHNFQFYGGDRDTSDYRDAVALEVLVALLSVGPPQMVAKFPPDPAVNASTVADFLARKAYAYADAMLKAREK